MRALRRWMRKVRCRAKYGPACPHGGHYGGKRRNSLTAAHTHVHKSPDEESDSKDHQAPGHRAENRTIDPTRADA